jgi:hypothetical protein
VKLRGRPEAPDQAPAVHGPLQRLLEVMLPPNELHLVVFQCFIGVMKYAPKGCVYQDPVVEMRPLVLRIRVKKDSILNASNDYSPVPHIDSDHVSDMNSLAVVVAHNMTSKTVKLRGRPEEFRAHPIGVCSSAGKAPSLTTVHGPPNDC